MFVELSVSWFSKLKKVVYFTKYLPTCLYAALGKNYSIDGLQSCNKHINYARINAQECVLKCFENTVNSFFPLKLPKKVMLTRLKNGCINFNESRPKNSPQGSLRQGVNHFTLIIIRISYVKAAFSSITYYKKAILPFYVVAMVTLSYYQGSLPQHAS